jgi:AraC family ethanolamine operon transcriptional activator
MPLKDTICFESSRASRATVACETGLVLRAVTSSDADDHARNLSGWSQEYDQFSPGAFSGEIAELRIPGTQLYLESTNQVLHQSCASWRDSLWLGIPVLKGQSATICAKPLTDSSVTVIRGGSDFELLTPANYQILGISIDENVFNDYICEVEHIDCFGQLGQREVLMVDPETKRRVCELLQGILSEAGALSAILGNTPSNEVLQDRILMVLATLFESISPVEDHSSLTQKKRKRIVEKIREYMFEHIEDDISIPDLCRDLHVSRRTLQYCTEDVVGMSPAAYMRVLRLNGVRRDLFFCGRDTQVTDVAMSWGFRHLSQFAGDYSRMFDMLPSETLSKRRVAMQA